VGFIPVNSQGQAPSGATISSNGTWTDCNQTNACLGLNAAHVTTTDVATPASKTVTAAATDFVIQYQAVTGGGTYNYNIDAGGGYVLPTDISQQNLMPTSQDFTASAQWSYTHASRSYPATGTTAPDGSNTATLLLDDATSNLHEISFPIPSMTTSTAYTTAFYAKAQTRSWLFLTSHITGSNLLAYVNLKTCGLGGSNTLPVTVQSVGNGWCRIMTTGIAAAGGTSCGALGPASGDNGWVYPGGGASGIYIWGASFNIGVAAFRYIATPISVSSAFQTADIFGLSNASHTVVVAAATVGSGLTLLGFEANINAPGVRLHQIGSPGAQASTYTQLNAAQWQSGLASLGLTAAGMTFGVNELVANTTPATQSTNLATMLGWIQAAAPYLDQVLSPPVDVGVTGTNTMAQYVAARYALAISSRVGFVTSYPRFGTFAQSSARSSGCPTSNSACTTGLWQNTSHVNATGGARIARDLYKYLYQQ
jgi:lysophospholipase L1-like esterase